MTVQLDSLARMIEADFARGLCFLRRAALSADDLERLSALNGARLNGQDRSKLDELLQRAHSVNLPAGQGGTGSPRRGIERRNSTRSSFFSTAVCKSIRTQ